MFQSPPTSYDRETLVLNGITKFETFDHMTIFDHQKKSIHVNLGGLPRSLEPQISTDPTK